jgi:hypothetical protein
MAAVTAAVIIGQLAITIGATTNTVLISCSFSYLLQQ